tara:strand:+ start:600 stop:1370 length:771 start_codon:yes stop_codon:yes gene_type:complete
MNYIPQDVIFHIFLFLSTPYDQSLITPVSKYLYHTYISSIFFKHKLKLKNRAYMIQEDYHDENTYDLLASQWESVFKFHWPEPKTNITQTPMWKINQLVDVKDRINVWGPARIINHKIEEKEIAPNVISFERNYLVRFLGWSKPFNEWVTPQKITFFGTKSYNPREPYKYLVGEHKRWVLYRSSPDESWHYASLHVLEEQPTKKRVMLSPYQRHYTCINFIDSDNIEQKLRYISNATVLFSNVRQYNYDDHRTLQY